MLRTASFPTAAAIGGVFLFAAAAHFTTSDVCPFCHGPDEGTEALHCTGDQPGFVLLHVAMYCKIPSRSKNAHCQGPQFASQVYTSFRVVLRDALIHGL